METWLTYRPSDFLLFSADTYWRLFGLANAALWPLPLLSAPVLIILIVLARSHPRHFKVGLAGILATSWIVVSEAFLAARYTPINWAIAYVRPLFLVEAALLAVFAWRVTVAEGRRFLLGCAFVVLAAFYPLLGVLAGRSLGQSEVFAIAPDPTAIGTVAALLLAKRSLTVRLLSVVPLAWLAVSALTLHTMGSGQWIVVALAMVTGGLSLTILPGRSPR